MNVTKEGRKEEERITCTEFSDTAYRTFSIPGLSAGSTLQRTLSGLTLVVEIHQAVSSVSANSLPAQRWLATPPFNQRGTRSRHSNHKKAGLIVYTGSPLDHFSTKSRIYNLIGTWTLYAFVQQIQSSANEQLKHLNADHFCLCSSFSISVAFATFKWETVNITTQTLFCFHNRCCSC